MVFILDDTNLVVNLRYIFDWGVRQRANEILPVVPNIIFYDMEGTMHIWKIQ